MWFVRGVVEGSTGFCYVLGNASGEGIRSTMLGCLGFETLSLGTVMQAERMSNFCSSNGPYP